MMNLIGFFIIYFEFWKYCQPLLKYYLLKLLIVELQKEKQEDINTTRKH